MSIRSIQPFNPRFGHTLIIEKHPHDDISMRILLSGLLPVRCEQAYSLEKKRLGIHEVDKFVAVTGLHQKDLKTTKTMLEEWSRKNNRSTFILEKDYTGSQIHMHSFGMLVSDILERLRFLNNPDDALMLPTDATKKSEMLDEQQGKA